MTYYSQTYEPVPPPKPVKPSNLWRNTLFVGVPLIALLIGIAIGAAGKTSTKVKEVAAPAVTVAGPTTQVTTTPTLVVSTAPGTVTTVTYTPKPLDEIGDGTYQVGVDITPGVYKTNGQSSSVTGQCYWARYRDLSGSTSSIIANNNFDGPTTIQIAASDKAVELDGGCTWSKS